MTSPPQKPPASPTAPAAGAPRNRFGTASLILGIVAFVGAFIPIFNYVAVFAALAGIVVGIIGLVLARRPKRAALAGAIISFVALILSVVLAIVYTLVFFGQLIGATADQVRGDKSLVYQVDGKGSDVDITYSSSAGGISTTKQLTGQSLPFEEELEVGFTGADTYNSYTITAVNGAEGGDVICRIVIDGIVLTEQTATGAYATASCTASPAELIEG
ncbi:MmpS family transport accessory protein [Herbiconiux liangxiaofengii]|uniref:MmpS family transport accessory protein n=1 Tax=Herbiconiux liangxiaofengii TaxID=3342795 RepID=UPI0035B791ED